MDRSTAWRPPPIVAGNNRKQIRPKTAPYPHLRAGRWPRNLDRPGIEPWLDQDRLKPGRWKPALTDALERSRYVLPLLSRHSLDPDEPGYVQTEWDIALTAEKLIVPILVEAIPETLRSSPWFKRMSDYQWYDLAADYEANLRKLLRALLADDAGDSFWETFSCDGPDREGWDLGDWSLSDEDATGHRSGSFTPTQASRRSGRRRRRARRASRLTSARGISSNTRVVWP